MRGTFTEQDIKRALDGTFTRITRDGNIVTAGHVEHAAPSAEDRAGEEWTAAEDDLVIKLRNADWKHIQIAVHLNRTKSSVDQRVFALRKAGRIA
jgi:hypothetical protein